MAARAAACSAVSGTIAGSEAVAAAAGAATGVATTGIGAVAAAVGGTGATGKIDPPEFVWVETWNWVAAPFEPLATMRPMGWYCGTSSAMTVIGRYCSSGAASGSSVNTSASISSGVGRLCA